MLACGSTLWLLKRQGWQFVPPHASRWPPARGRALPLQITVTIAWPLTPFVPLAPSLVAFAGVTGTSICGGSGGWEGFDGHRFMCGIWRELATQVLFHQPRIRENEESADHVLEFPDVAGPLVLKEEFLERGGILAMAVPGSACFLMKKSASAIMSSLRSRRGGTLRLMTFSR